MDILEKIEMFFEQNKLDDLAKVRYIYLYICNLFSYDTRYMFGTTTLKEEIYYKEIDVRRVEEYEIVCYTYSRVLQDVLKYFGYDSEIKKEESYNGMGHAYLVVNCNGRMIKLDATKRHDSTRVKLDLETYDFRPDTDDATFMDDVRLSDDELRSLNVQGLDYSGDRSISDFIRTLNSAPSDTPGAGITFYSKLMTVFSLMNIKKNIKRYDDADYYLGYLLTKIMGKDKQYIMPMVFFNENDKEMKDIINIILVKYPGIPSLYIMEKQGDRYGIREISKQEVLDKMEIYHNVCEYFFKSQINEAYGRTI